MNEPGGILGVLALLTPVRGPSSESTSSSKWLTYNEELDAFVCEVDLDDLEPGCEYSCKLYTYLEDAPSTANLYTKQDIFLYRTLEGLVTDRKQEDVDRVKELRKKWYDNAMTLADKAEWNAGLKGAINNQDIQRIKTKIEDIDDNYNPEQISYDMDNILGIIGPVYYNNSGFINLNSAINSLLTWIFTNSTQTQQDMYNEQKDFYYESLPPAVLSYNYFEAWNDVEKLLLLYFRILIYDIYEYKAATIKKKEPEPYVYENYLFATDGDNAELFMVGTDDEMLGLI